MIPHKALTAFGNVALARMPRLLQSMFMNRRKTPSAPERKPGKLAVEVESLRNEVRVLRQAIDEVREELQYINTNGLRLRDVDHVAPIGILKRMAADVTSNEWSERLRIDFGHDARTDQTPVETQYTDESQSQQSTSPVATPAQSSADSSSTSVVTEPKPRNPGQLF